MAVPAVVWEFKVRAAPMLMVSVSVSRPSPSVPPPNMVIALPALEIVVAPLTSNSKSVVAPLSVLLITSAPFWMVSWSIE